MELPTECYAIIFDYLSASQIRRLQLTCKTFYALFCSLFESTKNVFTLKSLPRLVHDQKQVRTIEYAKPGLVSKRGNAKLSLAKLKRTRVKVIGKGIQSRKSRATFQLTLNSSRAFRLSVVQFCDDYLDGQKRVKVVLFDALQFSGKVLCSTYDSVYIKCFFFPKILNKRFVQKLPRHLLSVTSIVIQ